MISLEGVEDVSVSLDGLSHHVVSVDIEVSILNGGLEVSIYILIMLLADFFLNEFEFVLVEYAIANGVSKDFHGLVDIISEDLKGVAANFSASLILLNGANGVNAVSDVSL